MKTITKYSVRTIYLVLFLLSCRPQDSSYSECLSEYSEETLDYFSLIGFPKGRTEKWKNDIRIKVAGYPSAQDILEVDQTIEDIKSIGLSIDISRVDHDENFLIYFERCPDTLTLQSGTSFPTGGTNTRKAFFLNTIKYARVDIYKEYQRVGWLRRKQTIRHEMMHALGLFHDETWSHDSHLSGPRWNNHSAIRNDRYRAEHDPGYFKATLTSLDREILRLLYSNCIPAGLKKEKYITALTSYNYTREVSE